MQRQHVFDPALRVAVEDSAQRSVASIAQFSTPISLPVKNAFSRVRATGRIDFRPGWCPVSASRFR
jgi:hypothetical protein